MQREGSIKKNRVLIKTAIAIGLFFTSFSPSALAQDQHSYESENIQDKYRYYRKKLKSDFLVIGSEQGKSLPIVIRNKWGGNAAAWGDATVHLGWYLGVLGTENYLLSSSNRKNELTENYQELYYAMFALQRLDNIAESHPSSQKAAALNSKYRNYKPQNILNGYFSRDDVPADFILNNPSLNESNTAEKKVTEVQSDWNQSGTNHEMSKDQVVHLLMGLKLIWKYLPDNMIRIEDGNKTVEINFKNWAEQLAAQILNITISKKKIINPVTQKLVRRGNLTNDIIYPLTRLKNEFKAGGKKAKHLYTSYTIWTGYKKIAHMKVDNLHMVMTLGSITPSTISRKLISKKADVQNWAPFYELLYDVVNNAPTRNYKRALTMLMEAPKYGLNHNMPSITNENKLHTGWECPNRFIKVQSAQEKGWAPASRSPNERMNGYFNGLDFMLLHNLYAIQSRLKLQ